MPNDMSVGLGVKSYCFTNKLMVCGLLEANIKAATEEVDTWTPIRFHDNNTSWPVYPNTKPKFKTKRSIEISGEWSAASNIANGTIKFCPVATFCYCKHNRRSYECDTYYNGWYDHKASSSDLGNQSGLEEGDENESVND